jgi:hypothetical protein
MPWRETLLPAAYSLHPAVPHFSSQTGYDPIPAPAPHLDGEGRLNLEENVVRTMIFTAAIGTLLITGACRRTAGGDVEVDKPVVGTVKDTVHTPSVDVGTRTDTVNVPTVGTKKDTVTVPTVGTRKKVVKVPTAKVNP